MGADTSYSWVFLSLLSAFSLATSDALAKRSVERIDEYAVAWLRLVFALPIVIVPLLMMPFPQLDGDFFKAFALSLPLELVTIVLYIKALKASPLGLTLPFLAVTPVFLIGFSYAILGERVSLQGGLGIVLIAAGGYVLNFHGSSGDLLAPFRAIVRERGSALMLIVAVLYSVTSSYGKLAIEHSSPLFFGGTYFIALTLLFTPVAVLKGRGPLPPARDVVPIALSGAFYGLMIITHMSAMKLTKVAYMISVKRSSLLMGVLFGYIFFREGHFRERFGGAVLMFGGFVMVVVASP